MLVWTAAGTPWSLALFREGQDASPQRLGAFPNRPEQFDCLLRQAQQQARGEEVVWVIDALCIGRHSARCPGRGSS